MATKELFWNYIKKVLLWYPANLAEIHESSILLLIIFGVNAFEGYKIDGENNIKHRRKRIFTIVTVGATFSLIICMVYVKLRSVYPTDFISYYSVIYLNCFNVIMAFCSVIIFSYKSKKYAEQTRLCISLNRRMINVGLKIECKSIFLFLIGHVVYFLMLCLSAIYLGYYVEMVALLYPYGIRIGSVFICCVDYKFFTYLFKKIKQYSKSVNERKFYESEVNADYWPNVVLDNINDFYSDLCDITASVIKIFELSIFVNLCANTIEIVAAVILVYLRGIDSSILTICCLYIFGNVIFLELYYYADKIHKNAKDVAVSIGLTNAYYMNSTLAVKRNTFLLLILQKKINLKIFNVVSLNLSIILTQAEICKTLLLILMQYLSKQNK